MPRPLSIVLWGRFAFWDVFVGGRLTTFLDSEPSFICVSVTNASVLHCEVYCVTNHFIIVWYKGHLVQKVLFLWFWNLVWGWGWGDTCLRPWPKIIHRGWLLSLKTTFLFKEYSKWVSLFDSSLHPSTLHLFVHIFKHRHPLWLP